MNNMNEGWNELNWIECLDKDVNEYQGQLGEQLGMYWSRSLYKPKLIGINR